MCGLCGRNRRVTEETIEFPELERVEEVSLCIECKEMVCELTSNSLTNDTL